MKMPLVLVYNKVRPNQENVASQANLYGARRKKYNGARIDERKKMMLSRQEIERKMKQKNEEDKGTMSR